jgi:hypothetical protein
MTTAFDYAIPALCLCKLCNDVSHKLPPNFSYANRYDKDSVGRCKFLFIRFLHTVPKRRNKGSDVVHIYTLYYI